MRHPQPGAAHGAGTSPVRPLQESLPWLVDATDDTFAAAVDRSPVPVLVDLWAPWCGPCRLVSPAVERAATRYRGRLKVAKVNVDTSPKVAARFQARSIPTLLLLKQGRVADRLVGAVPEPKLDAWVSRQL